MRIKERILIILLLTSICSFSVSYAGNDDDFNKLKEISANSIGQHPPNLDGRLDDPAWNHTDFASGFLQRNPNEGEAAMHKTEVGLLYDDHIL